MTRQRIIRLLGIVCIVLLIGMVVAGVLLRRMDTMMTVADTEMQARAVSAGTSISRRTAMVNQYTVSYIESGNPANPTMVFIHGSPGDASAFFDYAIRPDLLERYHMISLDRLGYGGSDSAGAVTASEQISVYGQFIASVVPDSESVVLVGHSLGGPIVLGIAGMYPDRVSDVVVVSGSVDPSLEQPEHWRLAVMYPPISLVLPRAWQVSNREIMLFKQDSLRVEPLYQSVTARVVAIHGTDDTLVPFANTEYIQSGLPRARNIDTVPVADAGHMIPWTHAEFISSRLVQLLQ